MYHIKMGQVQSLFIDGIDVMNSHNRHHYNQQQVAAPHRRTPRSHSRPHSLEQQQRRRRLDFNTNLNGRISNGLQGKGKHHLQKIKNQKQMDTVPQQIADPITGELLEQPAYANDGRIYNKSTIQKMKNMRGPVGISVSKKKYFTTTDEKKQLQTIKDRVKQFKKEHQKTPDQLGRYKKIVK